MKKIKVLTMLLFLSFSIYLIIRGQNIKGRFGLLMMLIGLIGLLLELFFYNRKYI